MQRPCFYKNAYATNELAQRAQASALEQRGTQTRVYQCDGINGCGAWHLTIQDAAPLKPGYRPARKSARDLAHERKRERARRRYG